VVLGVDAVELLGRGGLPDHPGGHRRIGGRRRRRRRGRRLSVQLVPGRRRRGLAV